MALEGLFRNLKKIFLILPFCPRRRGGRRSGDEEGNLRVSGGESSPCYPRLTLSPVRLDNPESLLPAKEKPPRCVRRFKRILREGWLRRDRNPSRGGGWGMIRENGEIIGLILNKIPELKSSLLKMMLNHFRFSK